MVALPTLALFIGACVLLALTPGPNMSLIVANTLSGGLRAGLSTSAGSSAGLAILVAVAATGMGSLMATMAAYFDLVRWLGALYLVVLGARQLWAWWRHRAMPSVPATAAASATTFLHGLAVALSNPKVLIFLGAFLPQFVDGSRAAVPQLMQLAIVLWATLLVTDLAYTLAIARARQAIASRWLRDVDAVAGCLLLAGGLILAGVRRPA